MPEPTPPLTAHDASGKRRARILAAGVLAALAVLGGSQVGSGRDVSQPLTPAASRVILSVEPAAAREYTVTSTSSSSGSVVLVKRAPKR